MAGPSAKPDPTVQPKLRLDKWLVFARFFKSRDLAAEFIEDGALRINAQRCLKPGHGISIGDVLTFPQPGSHSGRIRLIRIAALSSRRGSADQARTFYVDLDPPMAAGALE